jgi:hypothetical protein
MQGDVTDREVSLYIKPGSRGNVAIGKLKFHALWFKDHGSWRVVGGGGFKDHGPREFRYIAGNLFF